ncbi:hypothetical protein ACJ5NV_13620 [Loktanella agnita]|uniref:hypothetical protein n=1 Tax=Loktanella agnita TaxID=287097 RepID=UPI003987EFA5
MPTGTELFNLLDTRTQAISNALDELNIVITGDSFAHTLIWPTTDVPDPVAHAAGIDAAMAALTVTDNLEDAIDRLFDGLQGGSINDAIKSATDAIQKVLNDAAQLNDELGVQDRVDAFNELNEPAQGARTDPNFGFIPAIEGVINAAANSSVDVDDALGPLRAIGAAVAAGGAYAVFAAYATASIEMLNTALTVGQVGVGDR